MIYYCYFGALLSLIVNTILVSKLPTTKGINIKKKPRSGSFEISLPWMTLKIVSGAVAKATIEVNPVSAQREHPPVITEAKAPPVSDPSDNITSPGLIYIY